MAERNLSRQGISRRLALLLPLESAQGSIRQQIMRGDELCSARIGSESALNEAKAERDRWTDFNIELMTQLLSGNEYADQYRKFHTSISHPSWTLAENIRLFRAVVAEQNNQLKSDLERLRLIPEATALRAPNASGANTVQNVFNGPVGNVTQNSTRLPADG
jgi:hypothetical protein